MPFTPLHLGLGASCKAIAHKKFSFMIFAGTQVLMDLEPLVGMILGWQTLHLYTHHLIGAFGIGLVAILLGKPISEFFLRNIFKEKIWQISWKVAMFSAFIGCFSHIFLDAFMHTDMYPFFPFSKTQILATFVPYSFIFYTCLFGLVIGGIVYLLREDSDL